MKDYSPCKKCQTATHKWEFFPGDICLNCYKQTPEATRPITATELARMWGAKV